MSEAEKQFSLTRAASMNRRGAKSNFLSVFAMRHPIILVFIIVVSASTSLRAGQDEKGGVRTVTNDQGKLRLKSVARRISPSSEKWQYEFSVKNLETNRTMRVFWEVIPWGWNWVNPGEEIPVLNYIFSGEPETKYGVVRYWGGKPGEAIENTEIPFPPSPLKPGTSSVSARSEMRLRSKSDAKDISHRIVLVGVSKASSEKSPYRILYELSIQGIQELPKDWRVRWDSIVSPEFIKSQGGDLIQVGMFKETDFTKEIATERVPVLRLQSIRFVDPTGITIGQALLPAVAPPSVDEKPHD